MRHRVKALEFSVQQFVPKFITFRGQTNTQASKWLMAKENEKSQGFDIKNSWT